jgi:hypothetical protein
MRVPPTFVALSALALSACGGPLISQPLSTGSASLEGTAHGTYCLPHHLWQVEIIRNADLDDALKTKGLVATYGDTAVFARRITEADTGHLYRLGYNESALSNDTITVEYEYQCLLKKITSRVADESPSVIRDLASTIIEAATGAPTARVRSRSGKTRTGEAAPPDKVTMLLDISPASYRKEQDRLNATLSAHNYGIAVEIRPMSQPVAQPATPADEAVEGIFYAPPQAYVISVMSKSADGKTAVLDERVFYSANGVPVQYIAVDRSAFVERYTEISFARGLPYWIKTKKPSEAKEFATIPLDITTAILEAPVEALKWDADKAAAKAELYKNQEIMIQQQMKLIQAQDNWLKFQRDRNAVTVPNNIADPSQNNAARETSPQNAASSPADEPTPEETGPTRPPGPASDEIPGGDDSSPPR